MFNGPFFIQYLMVFIVFLIWFINRGPTIFYKSKDEAGQGNLQSGQTGMRTDSDFPGQTASRPRSFSLFGIRVEASDNALFQTFVLLAIGVILNDHGAGNRTAADVFSIIIAASIAVVALLHCAGLAKVGYLSWIAVYLSLLGLYITPWATHHY